MITKDKVIELVEPMPDTFSVDDLVERVLILEKIKKAVDQLANGQLLTSEQLNEEINKWQ